MASRNEAAITACAVRKTRAASVSLSRAFAHRERPGKPGSPVPLKDRYENFIGGDWIAPTTGEYRDNVTPSTGEPFCEVAHSGAQDIELALDAAYAAKDAWGKRSPADRAAVLNAVADAIDQNLEMLAVAESYENGKPVRETLAADIPLSADHFRYFAGAVRSEEGRISKIDDQTYAYHFQEPLGVVGQIIPFNFPLLMAAWKMTGTLLGLPMGLCSGRHTRRCDRRAAPGAALVLCRLTRRNL
jgi:aldehyde dehydrogenase